MQDCVEHKQKGIGIGYGTTNRVIDGKKRGVYLHRLAFFEYYGYWPDVCRHLCNNARCINPEHLADGTHADNALDRIKAGRSGKKLTTEQELEIQRLYSWRSSEYNVYTLAKKFGVSRATVGALIKRSKKVQK